VLQAPADWPKRVTLVEEAERAEPVVDGHHHDAPRYGEPGRGVVAARPGHETPAGYPNHHRQPPAVLDGGRGDVQEQAVLIAERRPSAGRDCRAGSRVDGHGRGGSGPRRRRSRTGGAA
jgi:hypothetical protein